MSTNENRALVDRFVDAFNRRDHETLESLIADDFVNHNPPPFPGFTADREGWIRIIQAFVGGLPDAHAEAVHVIAQGDLVVLHDIVSGRHDGEFMGMPASGKDVRVEFIHILRVSGGKIAERWGLVDVMGLMQQVGAMPAPVGAPV